MSYLKLTSYDDSIMLIPLDVAVFDISPTPFEDANKYNIFIGINSDHYEVCENRLIYDMDLFLGRIAYACKTNSVYTIEELINGTN